jgi:hypothetical protein
MDYGLSGMGSFVGRERNLSLFHSVQTGSGAQPISYSINIGDPFTRIKRLGRETDHSLPSSAEIENLGSNNATPLVLHCIVLK